MIWLGVYQYPNAAKIAGERRHNILVSHLSQKCFKCPRWGDGIAGVAITSNGSTALIATPTGVRSIKVDALNQSIERRSSTDRKMPKLKN